MAHLQMSPAPFTLPDEVTADVAVVGGGPAGLAAAATAARLGLRVAVVDEQPVLGGQYFTARRETSPSRSHKSATEREGQRLVTELATRKADLWTETLAWHLERDLTMHLYHGGRTGMLRARAVILAAGGREQSIPFPGWTLPGVTTIGAAQLLAKRHDIPVGKRILLAGSGPLLLAAASEMIRLGARVVGVLEASDPRQWLRHARGIWGHWDRLTEGLGYVRRMRHAGVPYHFRRAVIAAHGETHVESVDVASLGADGAPRMETVEQIPADALCVSFGLTPNIELAELAGAALSFDPAAGGWTPQVDAYQQTSVPGLFVAGETAAVAGAPAALLSGHIAGLAAAVHAGRLQDSELKQELDRLAPQRRQQGRFGRMVNTLFAPPPALHSITTNETIICRCEEVCAGEVRTAVAAGVRTLDALKTWTRVGQGPCQGRTCGPILAQLIASSCGRHAAEIGLFPARPPVKPVPLAAYARPEEPSSGEHALGVLA